MYIRLFKIITVLHISKYFPIYYIDYDIVYRVNFFSKAYDFPLTVCLGNDVSGIKLVMLSFFSPHFETTTVYFYMNLTYLTPNIHRNSL